MKYFRWSHVSRECHSLQHHNTMLLVFLLGGVVSGAWSQYVSDVLLCAEIHVVWCVGKVTSWLEQRDLQAEPVGKRGRGGDYKRRRMRRRRGVCVPVVGCLSSSGPGSLRCVSSPLAYDSSQWSHTCSLALIPEHHEQ